MAESLPLHTLSSNINSGSIECDVNGLTTRDALMRLHNGIEALLKSYTANRSRWQWIYDATFHSGENSLLCWVSNSILIICALILILISLFCADSNFRYDYAGLYGVILLLLVIANVCVVLWDSYLSHTEIFISIKRSLSFISDISTKCCWKPENYPHLCSPYSPCITLQWTYRDGSLVNLPWSLLVEGDLVSIRPGQPAPGHCVPISKDSPELQAGQVYSPVPVDGTTGMGGGGSGKLSARSPLTNKLYKLLETPYLRNLQTILNDSGSTSRPVTFHNRARKLLMDNCVEQLGIPLLLICIICVNAMRYIYLKKWVGSGTWVDMFVIIPITVILPLLPLIFPMVWVLLTCYGNSIMSAAILQQKTNRCDMKQEQSDPFEDTDLAEKGSNLLESRLPWKIRWQLFTEVLMGRENYGLIRSANLLHVLGSVTSLCCVDKKGILSWPNPTAEKIFFLRKPDTPSCSSTDNRQRQEPEDDNVGHHSSTQAAAAAAAVINEQHLGDSDNIKECNDSDNNEIKPVSSKHSAPHSHAESSSGHMQAEVLDLTHDHTCAFKLEFDDAGWKRHISSLKPLGLAILLNTCNMDTQEHYTQFCSHVTCEALYNEDLVPITNRRCLCEVAKQIGFKDSATQIFKLESQLSTFRHVQPESVRNDMRFARSLPPSTKLKFPFPHMVAVIMKEQTKHDSLQLFSQGTADIILDCCIEYWDGSKLCKLTGIDRRKVQDFYRRTSLSAYCTAFAYRPLFRNAAPKLSNIYMELPMDGQQPRASSPLPGAFSHFQSTDSLMTSEVQEPDVDDIEGCFKLQSNQIFIGMIAMQYQAQADIVQLIEQLEGACIRFVHFSKENELRSRVFSEKVGLESGWNCHISLLSDNNLLSRDSKDEAAGDGDSVIIQQQQNVQGDWQSQSLSCLTDSTEQSVPVNFDMSNRAKLPRGIENIRPHLDKVDNVPLLVSLFTDCTPSTTREMISIMQEYDEVVCVIGSSANADNVGIFLQANASIAIEPLYPQVCQKVCVCKPTDPELQGPSPICVSKLLNSIPCSVSISREDSFSIFHLITKARHYMKHVWNCTQYWVCCVVSLSCAQLLASLLMLPPLFSTGHVIWLSVVIIPAVSMSLVSSSRDPQVMKRATEKKTSSINTEMALFVLWCYGSKFLWTVCLIPVVFGAILSSFCENLINHNRLTMADSHVQTMSPISPDDKVSDNKNSVIPCSIVYPFMNEFDYSNDTWGGWNEYSFVLLTVQHVMVFLFTIHYITISVSFVHRDYLCWNKSPHHNVIWLIILLVVFLLQTFYTLIGTTSAALFSTPYYNPNSTVFQTTSEITLYLWEDVPLVVIIAVLISPVIVFLINEFVKWQEIKANVRYQKRARLEFGTKLGMNSPF